MMVEKETQLEEIEGREERETIEEEESGICKGSEGRGEEGGSEYVRHDLGNLLIRHAFAAPRIYLIEGMEGTHGMVRILRELRDGFLSPNEIARPDWHVVHFIVQLN